MLVEILQAAEFFDQFDGGFGSHSGNPGYVVGRIAHQGFDLDHLFRVNFPFFLDLRGVVYFHLGNAFFGHVDVGALRHQLQAVIVAGDDNAVHALLLRLQAEGADDVVGLETLDLQVGDIHGLQHFPDEGKLAAQFSRRLLAGALVIGEGLVAEGDPVAVEGHQNVGRLQLPHHPVQHGQKTVDGISIDPVPGLQQR